LKDEKDEDIDVSTLTTENGLVLFLVPKADTREFVSLNSLGALLTIPAGCTTQACGFRDVYPDFTSLNYEVYCLSADSPAAQTKWQTKVFNFPISSRRVADAADTARKVSRTRSYQIPNGFLSKR
jgi:peroxiredoxin Q/BCP